MLKSIGLLPRKVDTTRAAFCGYYESNHAPLAIGLFPFKKYVRNHLPFDMQMDIGFDTISEFWLDNFQEVFDLMGGDVGARMKEDERNFMDQGSIRSGAAEEHLIRGTPRGMDEHVNKTALLMTRDTALSAEDYREKLKTWAAGFDAPRVSLDIITPWDGPGPAWPFDAVVWLWGEATSKAPPPGIALWRTLAVAARETSPDKR